MKALRACLYAFAAVGAMAVQGANAAIQGDAAYSGSLPAPAFVPDVRALIVDAARSRGWVLIDERPGELTFGLQHFKSHMEVVARAHYSKSGFSFRKVSAKTFKCEEGSPCQVNPEIVQRWMVSLRREAGVALLRLAIRDAGGSVPSGRAPAAETE